MIFSSGSTGVPKGIMLSHFNLATNVDAVLQLFWLDERDRIIGVLPLFHSFGFMATIWLPLFTGGGVVYHPNPTDAKVIGELIHKYKGTFLLSTPTFCGTYMRKCTREQFASLRFVVVGAEKLREPLRKEFQGNVRHRSSRRLRHDRDVSRGGGEQPRLSRTRNILKSERSTAPWGCRFRE